MPKSCSECKMLYRKRNNKREVYRCQISKANLQVDKIDNRCPLKPLPLPLKKTDFEDMMFSWNDDRAHATTIEIPKVEDFGDKYNSLEKSTRQQIFTAFRANPNLFGIPTENLGFSQEEYESAFRLYNRTCVKPVQQIICDAYDRIYGATGVLTITPFSLNDTGAESNVK